MDSLPTCESAAIPHPPATATASKSVLGSSMEPYGGEIPAKLSDGGGGGSEDRLSALPDDVLIHILLKLRNAAVAARTSVLSNRWRRLWALLPELSFAPANDSPRIALALAAHDAPVLRRLTVAALDSTPDSLAAWLPIAARRISGVLSLVNCVTQNGSEVMAGEGGAFELPTFRNATALRLELRVVGFTMPPSGVFARLKNLLLAWIPLTGPCKLGDVVSSSRCPVLKRLTVQNVWGVPSLIIHSHSLRDIELKRVHGLQQLTVMAPALKHLTVRSCFDGRSSYNNKPVAHISAPLLASLSWKDAYDPRFTHFGEMEKIEWLATKSFLVFGKIGSNRKLYNRNHMEILGRRWRCIEVLRIKLFIATDITNSEYLMGDITRFPNVRNLALNIVANGHSCGASLYHVLRMCTGVTELYLTVGTRGSPEAQTACPLGCVCDQPANWKTDEFMLKSLRKIRIRKLRGTDNEDGFVKRLLNWATVLETMTVAFDCSVAESKAKEFCQMLQSFSKPGVCLMGPHFP